MDCGLDGGTDGVQDELPLALVEEQAEGEIAAEEGRENGEGNGFEQPDGARRLRWSGARRWRAVWLGSGARHEGFCMTLASGLVDVGDECCAQRL